MSLVSPIKVGSKLPSGRPIVVCVSPVLRLVTSTVLPGGTDPSVPPTLINWLLPDLSATARISPVGAKLPPSPLPPSQARNTAPKILNKKTVNKILIIKSSFFWIVFVYFLFIKINSRCYEKHSSRKREIKHVSNIEIIEKVFNLKCCVYAFPFTFNPNVMSCSGVCGF